MCLLFCPQKYKHGKITFLLTLEWVIMNFTDWDMHIIYSDMLVKSFKAVNSGLPK